MTTTMLNDLMPIDAPERALSAADVECLQEVRAVLARHDQMNRFGVTLLHKHFDVADGECLIETTDSDRREQSITVMRREDLDGQEVIETAWRFFPGHNVGAPMMGCIMGCFGPNTKTCTYQAHTGAKTG